MKYLSLLLLLTLFACKTQRDKGTVPEGTNPTNVENSAEAYIKMRKTVCFGTCPAYEFTLNSDGTAIYDGQRFTRKTGMHTKQFSPVQIDRVFAAFAEAEFYKYKDEYRAPISDLPTTYLTYFDGKKTKTIECYAEVPEALQSLGKMLTYYAESEGWQPTEVKK